MSHHASVRVYADNFFAIGGKDTCRGFLQLRESDCHHCSTRMLLGSLGFPINVCVGLSLPNNSATLIAVLFVETEHLDPLQREHQFDTH